MLKKCSTGQRFIFLKGLLRKSIHTLTSENDCSVLSRKIRMTPFSQNVHMAKNCFLRLISNFMLTFSYLQAALPGRCKDCILPLEILQFVIERAQVIFVVLKLKTCCRLKNRRPLKDNVKEKLLLSQETLQTRTKRNLF